MDDVKALIETLKSEVEVCTRNPVHLCEFKWNIDNATKFSRRLNSHQFPDECSCKPRFRVVAKFNEKYPEISNVNIGLQRVDDGKEVIYVKVEISLVSKNGVAYRTKNLNYTSCSDGSPYYCFSELYTASATALTFPTSISSSDTSELSQVRMRGLVGTYKHEKDVFLLPDDSLIVQGTIMSYGCCIETETLPTKKIQDDITQQSHIAQLLEELKDAYEKSQFTDVDLIVEDDVIPAHRFVLSLRSPVFRRMFEYETHEKETGKVHITDMEKQVVEHFLWYLYTGIVKEESWSFMCALYATAEKYEVYSLKTACSAILANLIDRYSVCGILELADLYHDEYLTKKAMEYITEYFSRIKDNEEWKSIINHNPKLAAEVLTAVSTNSKGKVY